MGLVEVLALLRTWLALVDGICVCASGKLALAVSLASVGIPFASPSASVLVKAVLDLGLELDLLRSTDPDYTVLSSWRVF
jgi:hypothetical protein